MKKLVIFFPGVGYGLDNPLLYYADFVYETGVMPETKYSISG